MSTRMNRIYPIIDRNKCSGNWALIYLGHKIFIYNYGLKSRASAFAAKYKCYVYWPHSSNEFRISHDIATSQYSLAFIKKRGEKTDFKRNYPEIKFQVDRSWKNIKCECIGVQHIIIWIRYLESFERRNWCCLQNWVFQNWAGWCTYSTVSGVITEVLKEAN